MNPPPAPPPFLIVIFIIFIIFIVIMAFRLARRAPASKKKFRDSRRNVSTTIEPASFEAKVIMMLQMQTGCRGKPNDKGLIEVYKKNRLVGIVKCCEDSWEVTPALINEMAKLRVGYHVEIAYIATSGMLPSMAMSEAKYHKIRILKIEAGAS